MTFQKKHTIKRERWKNGYWIVERNEEGKRTSWKKWSSDPIKKQKNTIAVQTKRTRKSFEAYQEKTGYKQPTGAFEQLKLIKKQIESYPNIKDVGKSFEKKGAKYFTPKILRQGKVDKGKLIKEYKKILTGKVKNEKEIEQIIQHRKKKLKNRIAVKIDLYTKDGKIATIDVAGILLEQEEIIYGFWENRYIDSNTIYQHSDEFREHLGNPRTYAIHPTLIPAGTITTIDRVWSLA